MVEFLERDYAKVEEQDFFEEDSNSDFC